ncbi:hypothetical protein GCM10027403_12150 [Arthrobacter tecti]
MGADYPNEPYLASRDDDSKVAPIKVRSGEGKLRSSELGHVNTYAAAFTWVTQGLDRYQALRKVSFVSMLEQTFAHCGVSRIL